jgi:hypothetical protein
MKLVSVSQSMLDMQHNMQNILQNNMHVEYAKYAKKTFPKKYATTYAHTQASLRYEDRDSVLEIDRKLSIICPRATNPIY